MRTGGLSNMSIKSRLSGMFSTKSMPQNGFGGLSVGIQAPPVISRDPLNLMSLNTGAISAITGLNARNVATAKIRLYAHQRSRRKMLNGLNIRQLSKQEQKGIARGSESADLVEIMEHPALE